MEGFLERLARIQQCVNGDGARNLRSILTTCREMLCDRGYETIVEHRLEDDERGLALTGERSSDGGQLRVYVCMEDRVGVKFARSVLDAAVEAPSVSTIIVSIDGPTPFTRKECSAVQFFMAIDLCRNVTRHCLVPRHTRIDTAELPAGMTTERLPRLLETDRVVQYHAWPCGTVVKIKRVFGGYEPIDYFRVVVPAGGV